jgi:hypothetical protein
LRASLLGGFFAGITLVDTGQCHGFTCDILNRFSKPACFLAIADIGGRHMQDQQMAQGINGDVHLRATLALGPVLPGASRNFPASIAAYDCR